jgi:hypothetical protein
VAGGGFLLQSPYLYLFAASGPSSFPSDNPDEQDGNGYDNYVQINLSDESFECLALCDK